MSVFSTLEDVFVSTPVYGPFNHPYTWKSMYCVHVNETSPIKTQAFLLVEHSNSSNQVSNGFLSGYVWESQQTADGRGFSLGLPSQPNSICRLILVSEIFFRAA